MYILFAVVVACFAIFFYRRYRLWKLGAPENLSDNKKVRFFGAFKEVFSQKRVGPSTPTTRPTSATF